MDKRRTGGSQGNGSTESGYTKEQRERTKKNEINVESKQQPGSTAFSIYGRRMGNIKKEGPLGTGEHTPKMELF